MVQKKSLKILAVILKYDYGDKDRGISLEKKYFEPALKNNCSEYKAFYYDIYMYDYLETLQKSILEVADEFKPDIIFFNTLRDEFSPKTLDKLKEKYTTINWFSDDHWRFYTYSKDFAPHFSYAITTYAPVKKEYDRLGIKVICASWGVDKVREEVGIPQYRYDISFVGGKSKERERIIRYLKNNDIDVKTFGNGWDNGRVSFEEMNEIFYHSKINLNLSNSQLGIKNIIFDNILKVIHSNILTDYIFGKIYIWYYKNRIDKYNSKVHNISTFFRARANIKNKESLKARHFEICGAGGFQLAFYTDDTYSCFYNKDMGIFKHNELLNQIKEYLEDDDYRESKKLEGYYRIKYNYSYDKIFASIIEKVEL